MEPSDGVLSDASSPLPGDDATAGLRTADGSGCTDYCVRAIDDVHVPFDRFLPHDQHSHKGSFWSSR